MPCTDPNCRDNFNSNNNETINTAQQLQQQQIHNHELQQQQQHQQQQQQNDNLINDPNNIPIPGSNNVDPNNANEDERKESIDSQEFLLGDNSMTDSSSDQEREQLEKSCSGNCQQYNTDGEQCDSDCQQYNTDGSVASCSGGQAGMERNQNNDFYDPLMNHNIYCNDGE